MLPGSKLQVLSPGCSGVSQSMTALTGHEPQAQALSVLLPPDGFFL